MANSSLVTVPFGPWTGIVDTKNPSQPMNGKLKSAANLVFSGDNKLSVKPGTAVVFELKDDQGSPTTVSKVLHQGSYMDSAIAIAWSSLTSKVYLYRLAATMDGWYDSSGALHATASPQPCAVLWTSVTAAPDVSVAEVLGTLTIANNNAIDVAGLYFATKSVTFSTAGVPTVADKVVNGTGGSAGTDVAYFTLVAAYHQHVWGWGYGAGNTAGYTSFRPELGKFSQPSDGAFQTADSIVFGDRVRALRERPLFAGVAGNSLYVGASKSLFRVTGYGRDSFVVETLDHQYGITGPKAAVAVGGVLYYWSSRGLARCAEGSAPEYLWDAIVGMVATVANEATVVLGFDPSSDQVKVYYDIGSGVRAELAFDTRRGDFVSTNGDVGLVIACAGIIEPIAQSTVTPPAAPAAPAIVSTSSVTNTTARFNWTNTDALAQVEVSYRAIAATSYTVAPLQAAGVILYDVTGLTSGTAHDWRVRAFKNGVYSSYAGPLEASQFSTTGAASGATPPAPPTGLVVSLVGGYDLLLTWANADPSLPIQVLRSTDGSYFTQVGSAVAGDSSATDNTGAYGTFFYQVRHVAADGTLGFASTTATITFGSGGVE